MTCRRWSLRVGFGAADRVVTTAVSAGGERAVLIDRLLLLADLLVQ